jgi:hypothetical protein
VCISMCHRLQILYWNHEDCGVHCDLAHGPHGRCETCGHRAPAGMCRLTHAPLPEAGGCCHHDVALLQGWQVVTRVMLEPLGIGAGETVGDVLARWDVPHERGDQPGGAALVDPDQLALPATYGVGTETVGEEPFPWPVEV